MLTIEHSSGFRRDYKRESHGKHGKTLDAMLEPILFLLAHRKQIPPRNRDHELTGQWSGYRECHIRPDLLLVYRITEEDVLRLARLGSHSEIFG